MKPASPSRPKNSVLAQHKLTGQSFKMAAEQI
jgi:hypothetical protein